MAKVESGNAALVVLGLTFIVMCCFLIVGLLIKAQLVHGAAAAAANAGALAATKTLGDVFAADITPIAHAKLDTLMQELLADPIYIKGEVHKAILKHTVPSQLQNELLAGHRGGAILLEALLAYRPFFSEQDLGRQLAESFQSHAEQEIIPSVKAYLTENGATGAGTIRFPVHGKIEVEAKRELHPTSIANWLQDKIQLVGGRGYALFINALDGNGITYDISGVPGWGAVFE